MIRTCIHPHSHEEYYLLTKKFLFFPAIVGDIIYSSCLMEKNSTVRLLLLLKEDDVYAFLGIRKCDTEFIIPGKWHVSCLKTHSVSHVYKWSYKFEVLFMGIRSLLYVYACKM